jgi:Nuclear protein MDM1
VSIFGGADRKEFKTEYKKRFRPFSQYEYVDGRFNKRKPETADLVAIEQPPPTPLEHHITADLTPSDPWYTEVIELRKKAGQYKVGTFSQLFWNGCNKFMKLNKYLSWRKNYS